MMQLYLNDSGMKLLKENIFEVIVNKNPYFSDLIRHWYENSGSAGQLSIHIQSSGIEFHDYYTLHWLTSQDIMSFMANLSPE
ncbi:UNVERIFIED_CONTAM: hypothetical protein RMT77_005879 [Armadillidium vulgare]